MQCGEGVGLSFEATGDVAEDGEPAEDEDSDAEVYGVAEDGVAERGVVVEVED